jgi:hypothetical protein
LHASESDNKNEGSTVRLKPEKVEDLSHKIAKELEEDSRVTLRGTPEEIERETRRVFLDDLRREDELMEEVERIIQEHRGKIIGKNIDLQVLRRKIRDQLVRERKIVL